VSIVNDMNEEQKQQLTEAELYAVTGGVNFVQGVMNAAINTAGLVLGAVAIVLKISTTGKP